MLLQCAHSSCGVHAARVAAADEKSVLYAPGLLTLPHTKVRTREAVSMGDAAQRNRALHNLFNSSFSTENLDIR